jgi:hypothetical protein
MSDENTQLILQKFDEKFAVLEADIQELKVDFEGLKVDFDGLKKNQNDLKVDFEGLKISQESLRMEFGVFLKLNDGYRKAADRVANLAFTLVGAAAAIAVVSPAVKSISEFLAR